MVWAQCACRLRQPLPRPPQCELGVINLRAGSWDLVDKPVAQVGSTNAKLYNTIKPRLSQACRPACCARSAVGRAGAARLAACCARAAGTGFSVICVLLDSILPALPLWELLPGSGGAACCLRRVLPVPHGQAPHGPHGGPGLARGAATSISAPCLFGRAALST